MSDKQVILVSACLMGEKCRYDGQNSPNSAVSEFLRGRSVLAVCPEVAGGLPVPRPPAEITGNKVLRQNGEDVTAYFEAGSRICLEEGLKRHVTAAILKSRSPACGCGEIYDGSFSGKRVHGDGIFTKLLKQHDIYCVSDEDDLDLLQGKS